jgi:hypothetical protein
LERGYDVIIAFFFERGSRQLCPDAFFLAVFPHFRSAPHQRLESTADPRKTSRCSSWIEEAWRVRMRPRWVRLEPAATVAKSPILMLRGRRLPLPSLGSSTASPAAAPSPYRRAIHFLAVDDDERD